MLPIVEDDVPEKIGPVPGQSILVVDDEPSIVTFQELMLKKQGYRVAVFSDSTIALEAFLKSPHSFDAVITDQTMPNMMGDELARNMLQVRPEIPIILCTGHSDTIDEASAFALGIKKMLRKPIRSRLLLSTIEFLFEIQNTDPA